MVAIKQSPSVSSESVDSIGLRLQESDSLSSERTPYTQREAFISALLTHELKCQESQQPTVASVWTKPFQGQPGHRKTSLHPVQRRAGVRHRSGMTLVIVLFVMLMMSMLLIGMLNTTANQLAATRNTADYERALYLAGAATHQAVANITIDETWTGTIGPIEFPAGSGHTCQATAVAGPDDTVLITAEGSAGSVTRRLSITLDLKG